MQIIGIGYNPSKIKTPPKAGTRVWDPQYKGRVGLTALNSQLGIAFLAEINRLARRQTRRISSRRSRRCASCCRTSARSAPISAPMRRWLAGAGRHRALQLQLRADAEGKDVPVELAIPTTDRWAGPPACMWSPMRPSLSSRLQYIDTHLDPVVQARCSSRPTM